MGQLNIKELQNKIAEFAKERDWEQFHSPKNISMALNVEASELMEIFQWMSEEDSRNITDEKLKFRIGEELSDVLVYLLRMADLLDIDLLEDVAKKMEANAKKYPAEIVRGSSKKYNEY